MSKLTREAERYDLIWLVINIVRFEKGLELREYRNPYIKDEEIKTRSRKDIEAEKYDLIWELINTVRKAKGLELRKYKNPYK